MTHDTIYDAAFLSPILDTYPSSVLGNLESKPDDYDRVWDTVCYMHDGNPNLLVHTIQDMNKHLSDDDALFFGEKRSRGDIADKITAVNTESLFGIQKKVGLICPECRAQDTMYKLYANRSADEGMTSYCVCRECNHQWTLRV